MRTDRLVYALAALLVPWFAVAPAHAQQKLLTVQTCSDEQLGQGSDFCMYLRVEINEDPTDPHIFYVWQVGSNGSAGRRPLGAAVFALEGTASFVADDVNVQWHLSPSGRVEQRLEQRFPNNPAAGWSLVTTNSGHGFASGVFGGRTFIE